MKSFRLYIRAPSFKPARMVTDYSPEEVGTFRERFKPLAEHYHRRSRLAGYCHIGLCLCFILVVVLPKQLRAYFFVGVICSVLFRVFASPRTPDCPGCQLSLEGLGAFCPECGSAPLQPGGWFEKPKCWTCGKGLRAGRWGRSWKIRACTHCGLKLDEKGL